MGRAVVLGFCLSLFSGLAGCGRFEPEQSAPLDPPAQFRDWWAKTEACSGRTATFERIHWYVVPGDSFDCPDGRCVGRWEDDHTIYIAASWVASELVVRHEMLHDLIDRSGHPDPPFGHGCPLTWATWDGSGSVLRGVAGAPRID